VAVAAGAEVLVGVGWAAGSGPQAANIGNINSAGTSHAPFFRNIIFLLWLSMFVVLAPRGRALVLITRSLIAGLALISTRTLAHHLPPNWVSHSVSHYISINHYVKHCGSYIASPLEEGPLLQVRKK
jgi:hypothetical protein